MTRMGDERGQTLALVVLSLAVLMGIVALAVDVGSIVVTRQREQSAADASVLAAIAVIYEGGSNTAAIAEAEAYAADNGFKTGVVVNIPPTEGKFMGDARAVEVFIEHDVSPIFGGALGLGPWTINARAVGQVTGAPGGFGVITLHPTNCQSLKIGSGSIIDVTNGGIYVNSDCTASPPAMQAGSSSALTADIISIVGTADYPNSAIVTPAPLTGQLPIPDPYANLAPPAASATNDETPTDCRVRTAVTFSPGLYNCSPLVVEPKGDVTFLPGDYVFRGGLEIKTQGTVTFGRGVYFMEGGGFKMHSNSVAVNTDGMLIYNSCNGICGLTDWVHIASGSNLTAVPYGDPYANLLFWQDKANTRQVDFNSNSLIQAAKGTGIYAPEATVEYDCGSTVPMQFVALNVHIGSNAKIIVDVGPLPPATVWTFGLVE